MKRITRFKVQDSSSKIRIPRFKVQGQSQDDEDLYMKECISLYRLIWALGLFEIPYLLVMY